jgi:hypothetical protein
MIGVDVYCRVRLLLDEGDHSQRTIADMTGASRGTVSAIARGTRTERPAPHGEYARRTLPLARCPVCGVKVESPCRLCRLRRLMARGRVSPPEPGAEGPLKLELQGEHRRRYEEVRAWREAASLNETSV